jgi:hypothetical protein
MISFNKGSIHRTDLKGYSVYSDQFKKNENYLFQYQLFHLNLIYYERKPLKKL